MPRARAHLIYPLGTILIPNKRQSDRPFARHILSDRLVRPTDPSARLMGLASWAVRATDPSARPARPLDRLVRPTAPSARRTCPPEHPLQDGTRDAQQTTPLSSTRSTRWKKPHVFQEITRRKVWKHVPRAVEPKVSKHDPVFEYEACLMCLTFCSVGACAVAVNSLLPPDSYSTDARRLIAHQMRRLSWRAGYSRVDSRRCCALILAPL